MIYLPSWYGFKLDQWRCSVLEVFITKHAILLCAVNADVKSNVLSLSPPGSCRDHSVRWGLPEAFWLLTQAARLSPEAVQPSLWVSWDQHLPSEHHQRFKPTGSPGEGWLFYLWKADVPFTHQIESLLRKTAVIGCHSRQAGLLVV